MNDLNYLLSRMVQPDTAGRLPNTDTVHGLPREVRKDATKIARYYYDQWQQGLNARRSHAISWIKSLSILSGIHYFKVDDFGKWIPLRKSRPGEIRAFVPLIEPYLRIEHGRLSANQIGCTATPITGRGEDAFWRAQVAQDTMNYWVEEAGVKRTEDEANQALLVFGGYAYYSEPVAFEQQVRLRTFPYCDMFPIPFDARSWDEAHGVGRWIAVSKGWLEQQDELYEMRNGKPPVRSMSRLASGQTSTPNWKYGGFSSGIDWGSKFDGAHVGWIWMKPTELNPYGEHVFMIEDEVFGYVSGLDQQGKPLALKNGRLPLHPVEYNKQTHDFWPKGFTENLVPLQLEMNRQVTSLLIAGRYNRGFVAYNSSLIPAADIQNSLTGLVPFKSPGYEERTPPIIQVPPANIDTSIGPILNLVDGYARKAANFDSGIVFGQQEGRTEGGPATQLLNANAQAPIQPVLDRKYLALKGVFQDVLDDIRVVWPAQKKVQAIGHMNMGREMIVNKSDLPGSNEIILSPMPLVINGKTGLLNLLMQLRSMPSDEKTPLITAAEFRRSLSILNFAPPGLELYDKTEQRIRWRIGQLINDMQQPAIPPAGSGQDFQQAENHRLAVEILREVILDPSFLLYGPIVQKALQQEMKYHAQFLGNVKGDVDNFDNAIEEYDKRILDNSLDAMEQNPNTMDGIYSPFGQTVGA